MSDLKAQISSQIAVASPGHVWVPNDFAAWDSRDAIDKTLQRLVRANELRRIERGLNDHPNVNSLNLPIGMSGVVRYGC